MSHPRCAPAAPFTATLFAMIVFMVGCSTGPSDDTADAVERRFPDVIGAVAIPGDTTLTWSFDVTISSPYDSPVQYADGWRVVGPGDAVYAEHTLLHDHAAEQPFTRRQTDVAIPSGVDEVTIQGRDLLNGYGGRSLTITLQTGAP